MTTSKEILKLLDERAAVFEFPVLNNAHWDYIGGRLRGFRVKDRWALIFEVLVFNEPELAIVTQLYGYGPDFGPDQWDHKEMPGIESVPDSPLWDASGCWIVGADVKNVVINGEFYRISCGASLPDSIHLEREDCDSEAAFARALCRRLGFQRIVPLDNAVRSFPQLSHGTEVFVIGEWDHPDIAAGQLPSDSITLAACAAVLCGESATLDLKGIASNTEWPRWVRNF